MGKVDSVVIAGDGKYSYLLKKYKSYYEVFYTIPGGYNSVDIFCKEVDRTIRNGKIVSNNINVKLGTNQNCY